MHRKKGKRGTRVPRVRSEADERFRAYEADEPLEPNYRPEPVEDTGLSIQRGWIDPLGITHRAILYRDKWVVLCDTPFFNAKVRVYGSKGLRITTDQTTCLKCVLLA